MKPLIVPSLLLISLFVCSAASGQDWSQAPVFADGDFWRYRIVERGEYMKTERELNGIYEVAYTKSRLMAYKIESDQKKELGFEPGVLLALVGPSDLEYLKFPLYPGSSWTTDYTFRPRRRDVDRAVTAVTKVAELLPVRTELGVFRAFKLEREARFRTADRWVYVYYWSAETRSVLKYEMEVLKGDAVGSKREIELIRFGFAR